ncbi:MAG: right-handed parallel beta-helix repeat-containing protein [Deltaproteobacteria bacterium]|nr:right-handed parallel beta-helix repeat-containing protein [Deltaproteobacteria bacterium]
MPRLDTLVLIPFLLAAACNDTESPDEDDTSSPDDTAVEDDTGETDTPEEGCITVDGGGGYASLNDAIRLASEGSIIEVCAGEFNETVIVNKSVTIQGAGYSRTIWSAPGDDVPFTILGVSDVTLEGIGFSADANGIEVEDASNVTLASLSSSEVGSHAIHARDVTDLTVSDCTFYSVQEGVVFVDGGRAVVSGCNFVNNTAFGVVGTGDAEIVVRDTTIRGTRYTELGEDGSFSDGFAVFADSASSLVLENNHLTDNAILGVLAQRVDTVSLSGDTITGGLFGVYQYRGDLSMDGVTITNPTEFGALWVGPSDESLSVTNSTFYGDPKVVSDYDLDDEVLASVGLYAEGNDITIAGTTVTGWNDAGAWLISYNLGGGTATLTDTTFDDNGRRGLLLLYLDAVATNLSIRNLRQVEEVDTSEGYYVDFPAASAVEMGTMAWTGGVVEDNEGWGISDVVSDVHVSGVTFSGNQWSAFIDFQGTSEIRDSTFTGSLSGTQALPCIWLYENTQSVIEGNLFSENDAAEFWDDYSDVFGYEYWVVWKDFGTDIQGYSGHMEVRDNTFENGHRSLQGYDSTLVAEGNTWTGYSEWVVGMEDLGSGGATLTDSVMNGCGGYLVSCSGGQVAVDGLEILDQGPFTYTYDTYPRGEYESTYTESTALNALSIEGGCELTLSNATINGLATGFVKGDDSNLHMEAVTITASSVEPGYAGDVVALSWSSRAVEFYASNVFIEAPAYGVGIGLTVSGSSSTTQAEMHGVTVQSPGDAGISLSGISGAVLDGVVVQDSASYGVYLRNSAADLTGVELTGSASTGLLTTGSTLTVSGGTFSSNAEDGAWLGTSTADVRGATFSDNSGSGLVASGSTLSAVDNTITGNGEYGISCQASTTVVECGNAISGNGAGDNDACDASCDDTP